MKFFIVGYIVGMLITSLVIFYKMNKFLKEGKITSISGIEYNCYRIFK